MIKPLRKIVRDIADKVVDSREFNTKEWMLEYVRGLGKADKPDFSKTVAGRAVEAIQKSEFAAARARRGASKRSASTERRQVVPRNCPVNVTAARIAEIYEELRKLKLDEANNPIAVLMRVFLELSVDHFLEKNGVSLTFSVPGQGDKDKRLEKKLADAVDLMTPLGVPKRHLDPVVRGISVQKVPSTSICCTCTFTTVSQRQCGRN